MSEIVLFVHGAAGDARIWQPVIDALPEGVEGRALTLTYFGSESWPDAGEQFGTEIHAQDIIRAARDAGQPVHLVCWSYGVHPGLAALLDARERFASALFYEAAMPHYIATPEGRRAFGEAFAQTFGPISRAVSEIGPQAGVTALIGPGFPMLPEERRAIYLSNAPMMPLLFGGGLPPRKITPRELETIALPCCAALGSATQDVFALSTKALAEAIPGARLEVVEGKDHFLPETEPARFAALVADWVRAL
jgi:pimeloyl-ACP methyl ester carboxylesterase